MGQTISSVPDMISYAGDLRRAAKQTTAPELSANSAIGPGSGKNRADQDRQGGVRHWRAARYVCLSLSADGYFDPGADGAAAFAFESAILSYTTEKVVGLPSAPVPLLLMVMVLPSFEITVMPFMW